MSYGLAGRPIEILLVEDNPGDVRLTIEGLTESKVRNNLHVARDGVEAMAFLRREGQHAGAVRPDLILLDLNLPRMDGREVLSAIKSDAETQDDPGGGADHVACRAGRAAELRAPGELLHHQTGGPGAVHHRGEIDRRLLVDDRDVAAPNVTLAADAHPCAPDRGQPG